MTLINRLVQLSGSPRAQPRTFLESTMEVQVSPSMRGNSIYSVNSYLFEIEKKTNEILYCRCIRKKPRACARVILRKEVSLFRT